MLDFFAAQELILKQGLAPSQTETLALNQLGGKILATDIFAQLNNPPADNSAMDGYAINSNDNSSQGLKIQDQIFAGQSPVALKPGHAMRIFTGGLIPAGANCVVIQEQCTVNNDILTISGSFTAGDYIRKCGEDIRTGSIILKQGCRLKPGHIAVLAAQGHSHASVYKGLTIGILSTGDELIEPGQPLPAAAIYNSNNAMLANMCQQLGINQLIIKHAKDDLATITDTIASLSQSCDLILTVGGVSVGDKDYIRPAISNLGGSLDLWRVKMKPGKPVALAQVNGCMLLGLPGNPVSAFVVFTLLASPLIRKMQGHKDLLPPVRKATIKLQQPIKNGIRTDFIRIKANYTTTGLPEVTPYHLQSSGAISSLAWADGLALIPAETTINNAAVVNWYAFSDWLY